MDAVLALVKEAEAALALLLASHIIAVSRNAICSISGSCNARTIIFL